MARITQDILYKVERTTSMVKLCRSRGIVLRPRPNRQNELMGRCPFHPGKNSSFVVITDKNLFHCTTCYACGGVLDFVVKADGIGFREATEVLLAVLPSLQLATPRKPAFDGNSVVVKRGAESHAANS